MKNGFALWSGGIVEASIRFLHVRKTRIGVKVRQLEECYYGFVPIERFDTEEELQRLRDEAVKASDNGLAAIVYGCHPNRLLFHVWDKIE